MMSRHNWTEEDFERNSPAMIRRLYYWEGMKDKKVEQERERQMKTVGRVPSSGSRNMARPRR